MRKYSSILILIFGVALFSACEETKPKVEKVTELQSKKAFEVQFNADSAFQYIAQQVAFGPRIPNSKAHDECAQWLEEKFKSFALPVIVQKFDAKGFDGKILKSKNIIAQLNPGVSNRIIIASHWDSRPWADQEDKESTTPIDGANDGASGVGVALELARIISIANQKPNIGIDFILFDSEDYGKPMVQNSYCLGSQYWSLNKHGFNYKAKYGILLDMVGAPNAVFYKESYSEQFAPKVNRMVWAKAQQIGYGQYFNNQEAGAITDDHYYVSTLGAIPMIDIIQYHPVEGFGHFWHTSKDNMEIIDKNTLKAVGQTLVEVIYDEK